MIIPNIIYNKDGKIQILDIFSRMLSSGVIFINSEINPQVAALFIAQIIHIQNDLNLESATIYINSPGGCLYSGLAIVDTMLSSKLKISTYCTGIAASAASIIFAAGTKGCRFATPHSRIMIHQPLGRTGGQATDIQIYAAQLKIMKEEIAALYNKLSYGIHSIEFFLSEIERDCYLKTDKAQEYGLLDHVCLTKT